MATREPRARQHSQMWVDGGGGGGGHPYPLCSAAQCSATQCGVIVPSKRYEPLGTPHPIDVLRKTLQLGVNGEDKTWEEATLESGWVRC